LRLISIGLDSYLDLDPDPGLDLASDYGPNLDQDPNYDQDQGLVLDVIDPGLELAPASGPNL